MLGEHFQKLTSPGWPEVMSQVSIIVCTRNRADVLPACLKSIEAAAAASPAVETELIVVDNGSADSTAAELRAWQQTTSLCCKVVFAEKRGLSYARNWGLEQTTGRIIVLTDDDCRLAPDYLAALVQAYDRDIGPALRGGRVELGDARDLPFTIKTDLEPQQFAGGNPGGFVHGCNLTMTRSVVELVGYFDTSLGAGQPIGAADDTDFVYRAYRAGVPVSYDPSMVVFHHHGRRDLARIKQLQNVYDISDGAIYAKYGFRDWRLLLHVCRRIRGGLREYFGGPLANEELGLSHREILRSNLRGAILFWRGVRH
jgi:glycosyltransferase involved in cell wall biosynthesis